MMIMAVVLNLCSEADAFIAASFRGLLPDSAKWVDVKGILSMKKNAGVEVQMISAESLEYVEEPLFLYVL